MTNDVLRAYALRGLNARLDELNRERTRILELLAAWGRPQPAQPAASHPRPARKQPQGPALKQHEHIAPVEERVHPPAYPDVEEARILPRRRQRDPQVPAAALAPALPPMPRLVKAKTDGVDLPTETTQP